MKVKEFVNELKYYQMFLGEVISAYYINEAICDFAEQKKFSFASYGNCLGQISSALIRSQFVLCDILLRNSTQSKCIPRTIERIFNEPFGSDKKLKEEIQSVLCVVKDELTKIECDLKELGEYAFSDRDGFFYADWTGLKNIDLSQIMQLISLGAIGNLLEVESVDGDVVKIFVE